MWNRFRRSAEAPPASIIPNCGSRASATCALLGHRGRSLRLRCLLLFTGRLLRRNESRSLRTHHLRHHHGCCRTLCRLNPRMRFFYVSGAGTDSTERGRSMWARVKGKTENALLRLPFAAAYMFRPGLIYPCTERGRRPPSIRPSTPSQTTALLASARVSQSCPDHRGDWTGDADRWPGVAIRNIFSRSGIFAPLLQPLTCFPGVRPLHWSSRYAGRHTPFRASLQRKR